MSALMRWLSENYKWLFDGIAGAAILAVIGVLARYFRRSSRERHTTAKVENSSVVSGSGNTQTVNSPTTINVSVSKPPEAMNHEPVPSDPWLELLKEKQRLEMEVESLEARPDLDNTSINTPFAVRMMTRGEMRQAQLIDRKKRDIALINEKLRQRDRQNADASLHQRSSARPSWPEGKGRPLIIPLRYGAAPTSAGKHMLGYYGLVVANHGEPAYDVSILTSEIQIGTSKLKLEGNKPTLTRADADAFFKAGIEESPRRWIFGSGLFDEMRKHHVEEITVELVYKDADNRWYTTVGKIERNVSEPGGLAVRYIRQDQVKQPGQHDSHVMETTDALRAIQQEQKADQEIIQRLRDEGLIEVADATHFQSPGREYIPTNLTAKGLGLLQTGKAPTEKAEPESIEPKTAHGLSTKRWDVFISHASEDKEKVARPLAEALTKCDFLVWYDDFTLKLGDSLRESIDRGLAESRYGVVILSKHFFEKRWPTKELNGLTAIEIGGRKVILPIWHGVTHEDVVKYSPTLADKKAINTDQGLDRVVAAIEEVLHPPMEEGLREQLHEAEETLQEFHCSYCGAPLLTRSPVQLSEDDDGTYEDFACGYAHIDGHVRRPCPSDPKFPKLDDFEFTYEELKQDPLWKWKCFANGKTKEAQMLHLMPGLGRTKEEAREQIGKWYREYSRPWKKR